MNVIGIILIIFGSVGFLLSFMMFGDIGIAAAIGSCSILSGAGFMLVNKRLKQIRQYSE